MESEKKKELVVIPFTPQARDEGVMADWTIRAVAKLLSNALAHDPTLFQTKAELDDAISWLLSRQSRS